jgi:diguanylate cyclase (GGDEF)-like protein
MYSNDDLRRQLDATNAALESTRRVRRAMTTLVAARHGKQIDRRLVHAIIDATPYQRAALLDPPTPAQPARLRLTAEREAQPPLQIVGVPTSSPLHAGTQLERIVSANEGDLFPLHFAMLGRGAVAPLIVDGRLASYVYADAYDESIPADEAERSLLDLVDVAALARANAALIADRDQMVLEARELARSDPLTGLPNRTAFIERLESEVARYQRTKAPVSLAILDIDHFKQINDRDGHAAGDSALVRFANALRMTARDSDLVVRFAGDEFAVILIEATEAEATVAMHRALDAIHITGLTASIGIAEAGPNDHPTTLFERADTALYQAKQTGRDRIVPASLLIPNAKDVAS